MDTARIDGEAKYFRHDLFGGLAPASRLLLLTPVVCAAAYPSLSQLLSALLVLAHGSPSPTGLAFWLAVIGSLALALGVMSVSFIVGQALGAPGVGDRHEFRGRCAAHIAFATPSLFVGFGNVANLLHMPVAAPIAWPIFWAAMAGIVLAAPNTAATAVRDLTPAGYRRLGIAHGISACMILLVFLAPHLANHVSGIVSGSTHIGFMKAVRVLYRDHVIEPLLLALVGFQIVSGGVLVRRRMRVRSDFFGTLQSMSGVYVGIYFVAHLTAVFSARHAGTDTDWNWLTNHDRSMLTSLSGLRLIAHYWFGPIAIVAHLGCGSRMVLRESGVAARLADFVPLAAIAAGVAISSVILVALLGFHLA